MGRYGLLISILLTATHPAVGSWKGSAPPSPDRQVRIITDVPYVSPPLQDDQKQRLNLYLPEGETGYPVVLFVHGGAWSSGDRRLYGSLGSVFARNGIGAVIIGYRLSPQVTHPCHVQDVASAFAWTRRHIAEYGGDPDQLFVTGQSAGGHLAALLATNDRYLREVGLSVDDIRGCMPLSGVYTFHGSRSRRILGDDPDAPSDASPIQHVTGKEPPFLILYADRDFPGCRAMSEQLGSLLTEKGVGAEVRQIDDRNHISIILRAMLTDSDPTSRALIQFVREHSAPALPPK